MSGSDSGSDGVIAAVYDELRRLARRQLGVGFGTPTLQPTALVHEAYVKLAGREDLELDREEDFLRLAASVMRNVLVDHLRARRASKRGGQWQRVTLSAASDGELPNLDVLALDEAIQKLARLNERKAQLVELRFFGGLTETEAARVLGISRAEATRQWRFVRAWLQNELRDENAPR